MDEYVVGPFSYEVFERPDHEMGSDIGIFQWWAGGIRIRRGLEGDVKGRVILHELVEAMNEVYGLNLGHHQIDAVTTAFYALLKDNCGSLPGVLDV